uniref:Nucleolar protein 16 n=1 Tax=Corethrella appendiculata TaxID=1370023 RepID=U5EUY2_9DIPT
MGKQLRKTRMRKTYMYNVNRKRLNQKINGTGKIKDPIIKQAFENKKSISKNLDEMGLANDPNKSLGLPNNKKDRLKLKKTLINGFVEEDIKQEKLEDCEKFPKIHVAKTLEEKSKVLRESKFRLPKGQVKWITYCMDKHGFDYKAMSLDRKNYYQETWRQIRAKIKKFLSIPEQCTPYLEKKGFLDNELDPNDSIWKEYTSDDEEV